jgi:hypothetical protein
VTERLRDCAPVPHDLVQVDQTPNADVAQWIGHGPLLHVRVSSACGHALPPFVGGVLVRLRDWMPLPHDFVQVNQDSHVPTSQLTGHAWLLQSRVSAACGHALPPNVGSVCARLRCCEPAPHDTVQVDQLSKVPSSQSTAQF